MFVATFGVEYWLSVGHVKYENLFLFSEDTAFFACETKLLTETLDELEKFLRRLQCESRWYGEQALRNTWFMKLSCIFLAHIFEERTKKVHSEKL